MSVWHGSAVTVWDDDDQAMHDRDKLEDVCTV